MSETAAVMGDAEREAMRAKIRKLDLHSLGYEYCRHCHLPWLSWPLLTLPIDHARWFRAIVATIARSPVCHRTEADCWRELGMISNSRLAKLLATIAPRTEGER